MEKHGIETIDQRTKMMSMVKFFIILLLLGMGVYMHHCILKKMDMEKMMLANINQKISANPLSNNTKQLTVQLSTQKKEISFLDEINAGYQNWEKTLVFLKNQKAAELVLERISWTPAQVELSGETEFPEKITYFSQKMESDAFFHQVVIKQLTQMSKSNVTKFTITAQYQ